MAYKIKTEGGSGGKRGHSGMTHWDETEYIKLASTKARRKADKTLARRALRCEED